MVLKSSISNTRKFFQKTINNFKSFFSNNATYQKLPKTPINNNHHHPIPNIITSSSSSSIHNVTKTRALTQQQPRSRGDSGHSQMKHGPLAPNFLRGPPLPRRGDIQRDETLFSKPKVEFVHRKLKEMEKMVNDDDMISNEEHLSDVREFLHCYSRLRYTAYLDVVEHFFIEVYSDFFREQSRSSVPLRHASTVVRVGSYGGHYQ